MSPLNRKGQAAGLTVALMLLCTPASRSTTGAPILDPTNGENGEIIDSAGGGAKDGGPSKQPTAEKQEADHSKPWSVQCAEFGKDVRRCQISGSVLSADGKQVILVISLAPTADAKATAMQMAVPLGIALKAGVKIAVADAYETSLPISRCTPQGCLVEGPVEQAFINAMKAKAQATITVTTPDGKAVPITLPLTGFSDAFAAY
jgi:invasion protein IalB